MLTILRELELYKALSPLSGPLLSSEGITPARERPVRAIRLNQSLRRNLLSVMKVTMQVPPYAQYPDLSPGVCVHHGYNVLEIPGEVIQSSM
jgi:hypothetical protein